MGTPLEKTVDCGRRSRFEIRRLLPSTTRSKYEPKLIESLKRAEEFRSIRDSTTNETLKNGCCG